MAEYIEKQKAIDNIEKSFDKETILNRFIRKIAISAVRRMEPADVRPVVRGRWKMDSDRPDTLICSACDHAFDVWKWDHQWMHFCPNCGSYNGGDAE